MLTSTKKHTKYWKDRKIDWKTSYFDTWEHPHRGIITYILKGIPFRCLWEVGVGGGANLARILKDFKGAPLQLGGSDVSADAIEFCKSMFPGGHFEVESANDMIMSDNSIDVVLSDMTLIYVDPRHIDSYIKEFKRVARSHIVLVEFHSKSWWKRLKARFGGYHVYDYQRLLEKHGFYNVTAQHIPEQYWPGTDKNTEFRSIITAKC